MHDAAILQGDFLHQFAQTIDHTALQYMLRSARINRMATDVRRYPNLVDLYLLVGPHGDFGDLRNVASMVEMAGDAERRPRRQLAFAPTGLLRYRDMVHYLGMLLRKLRLVG